MKLPIFPFFKRKRPKEYIVCAAVLEYGRSLSIENLELGTDHHSIALRIFGRRRLDRSHLSDEELSGELDIYGFLTSNLRFVNCLEAATVAKNAGQLKIKLDVLFPEAVNIRAALVKFKKEHPEAVVPDGEG